MEPPLELTACTVDLSAGRVWRSTHETRLTSTELRLLRYLVHRPEHDVAQAELLREVWQYDERMATRAVAVGIRRLRQKIERDPSEPEHIVTSRGRGYRFVPLPGDTAKPRRRPSNNRFFGRHVLRERLAQVRASLTTLTGPGGIGKTRLARELLGGPPAPSRPSYWADLSFVDDAEGFIREVSRAVGLSISGQRPSDDDIARRLVELGSAWLVLDNLEHVVDLVTPSVGAWIDRAPDLQVLCTSREALRIDGERVFALGPLAPEEGRALFVDRAMPGVPQPRHLIDALVRRLDGMPLAIELAARLTTVLGVDQILARVAAPLDVLRDDRRLRPARHSSLRHAIAGSVRSLDPEVRETFGALSIIRGTFSVHEVEALVGDVALEHLRVLVGRSLVAREADRLRLLHPIRAYAAELVRDGVDVLLRWGRWLVSRVTDPEPDVWFIGERLEDLRELWAGWGRRRPDTVDETDEGIVARALWWYASRVGPAQDAVRTMREAVERPCSDRECGRRWVMLGRSLQTTGDREGAAQAARNALAIAQAHDDPQLLGQGYALSALSDLWATHHDSRLGLAIEAFARADDPVGMADVLCLRAYRHGNAGDWKKGRRDYERAVVLCREQARALSTAHAKARLGFMMARTADPVEAEQMLRNAVADMESLGERLRVGEAQFFLGRVVLIRGQQAEATRCFEDALNIAIEVDSAPQWRGIVSFSLGIVHLLADRPAAALATLRRAEAWIQDEELPALRLLTGWAEAVTGDPSRIATLLTTRVRLADDQDHRLDAVVRGLLWSRSTDAEAAHEVRRHLALAEARFVDAPATCEGWGLLEMLRDVVDGDTPRERR